MRRVAGVFPRQVSLATFIAAIAVAVAWVLAALYVAARIVSTHQPAPPPSAQIAPEPSQVPNRAAKEARETIKKHARLAPDPSRLGASHRAPQDEASRLGASHRAPQDEASRLGASHRAPQDEAHDGAPAETGRASWYDLSSMTASGEAMDPGALTAAHPSLPLGSHVRVANLDNGRVVVVRINDRGPFAKDRIIDLSKDAAERLDMIEAGVARVSVSPVELIASIKASGQASTVER